MSGTAICGLSDKLGSLEPRRVADFICVAGNPAEVIAGLERVTWVMKSGRIMKAVERESA